MTTVLDKPLRREIDIAASRIASPSYGAGLKLALKDTARESICLARLVNGERHWRRHCRRRSPEFGCFAGLASSSPRRCDGRPPHP